MQQRAFTLRRALEADAEAIARVHIDSWRTTYAGLLPAQFIASRTLWSVRYPMWLERLRSSRAVFAAEDGEGVFGFACACVMPERPQDYDPLPYDAYLQSIYLLAGRQHRGAGRALLGAVAGDLLSGGYRSMALHVLATNPARGFYERLGAVHVRDEEPESEMTSHACAYAFENITHLVAAV